MTAYRYVVFPPGRQPTVEEASELQSHASRLGNHIAFGSNRQDGGLAIAFEAEPFDRAIAANASFGALIQKWEARGCQRTDHLGFVKDAAALKPIKPIPRHLAHHAPADRPAPVEEPFSAKELAAKEAAGRARLELDQTLERFAALARFAAWGPYLLMGLAALGTMAAGFYVFSRLSHTDRERHKEAIERLSDDPMGRSPAEEPREGDGD